MSNYDKSARDIIVTVPVAIAMVSVVTTLVQHVAKKTEVAD